ncbi:MAG: TlpA disulfide reductase family protein [Candidatus Kapaibacteriota bacterium]
MNIALMLIFFTTVQGFAQVRTVKIEALTSLLNNDVDSIYVMNFWATWCKPCIEELPFFEEAHVTFADKNVKVILVSLDSPSELDRVLLPFIKKKNITSEILLLDESNPNSWIDKIEKKWTGSLPATIIQHNRTKKRLFFEQQLEKEQLFTTIQSLLE